MLKNLVNSKIRALLSGLGSEPYKLNNFGAQETSKEVNNDGSK